jgi:hypothetical protein
VEDIRKQFAPRKREERHYKNNIRKNHRLRKTKRNAAQAAAERYINASEASGFSCTF